MLLTGSLHVATDHQAFAETEFATGLAAVSRIDAQRVVTVAAENAAGYNSAALLQEVQAVLADFEVPAGYSLEFTGENEDQEEASAFLSDAFGLAIMLIFVVLVSQFSSVTTPMVILFSVILSLIGVLGGLMLGYGARLAYGCNIGAFFSGVASGSLHGWVWVFAAVVGNVIGTGIYAKPVEIAPEAGNVSLIAWAWMRKSSSAYSA